MVEIKNYKKEKPENDLVVRSGKKSEPKKNFFWPIIILIGVVLILGFSGLVNYFRQPVSDQSAQFSYFEVKKGKSTLEIGRELKQNNLIRSSIAFYVVVKLNGDKLQSGHYKLSGSMKMSEIIKKFASGDIDAFAVTVPEGYRVLQIAKLLKADGGIDENKFIEAAAGTEGTLFPDTYVFPTKIEPATIVQQMKDNYAKKTAELRPSSEQMILASIVQRETMTIDEMPKIAAVYKNRANSNMLFQADPTVRYAIDTQTFLKDKSVDFTFWTGLTKADLTNTISAFNTYRVKGYPPAPICNPGLDAIRAAINPEPNFDYLFFFHDKNIQIHFSKTYADHLKAIQEFGVAGS